MHIKHRITPATFFFTFLYLNRKPKQDDKSLCLWCTKCSAGALLPKWQKISRHKHQTSLRSLFILPSSANGFPSLVSWCWPLHQAKASISWHFLRISLPVRAITTVTGNRTLSHTVTLVWDRGMKFFTDIIKACEMNVPTWKTPITPP